MLKISTKRGREWNEEEFNPNCSPHKIFSMDNTPTKRSKGIEEAQLDPHTNAHFRRPSSPRNDSPFMLPQNVEMEEKVEKYFSKKTKQPTKTSDITDQLFSYDQVKEIVNHALAEKEANLRAEYDQILRNCLEEQFKNFTKFNEDYISRQLKQNDFSYLS